MASMGQCRRTHDPTTPALKARFTIPLLRRHGVILTSDMFLGLETIPRIDARFQRLVYRTIGFLG